MLNLSKYYVPKPFLYNVPNPHMYYCDTIVSRNPFYTITIPGSVLKPFLYQYSSVPKPFLYHLYSVPKPFLLKCPETISILILL